MSSRADWHLRGCPKEQNGDGDDQDAWNDGGNDGGNDYDHRNKLGIVKYQWAEDWNTEVNCMFKYKIKCTDTWISI